MNSLQTFFGRSPKEKRAGHSSLRFSDSTTLGTLANRLILRPVLNDRLELGTKVSAVEGILANDCGFIMLARLAVPSKAVCTIDQGC